MTDSITATIAATVTTQANVYFDGKCVSHGITLADGSERIRSLSAPKELTIAEIMDCILPLYPKGAVKGIALSGETTPPPTPSERVSDFDDMGGSEGVAIVRGLHPIATARQVLGAYLRGATLLGIKPPVHEAHLTIPPISPPVRESNAAGMVSPA